MHYELYLENLWTALAANNQAANTLRSVIFIILACGGKSVHFASSFHSFLDNNKDNTNSP